jgi:hypothetical protein
MSTFKQIQDAIYVKMQESSSNTAFPLASIKSWINEGYRDICSVTQWPFLFEESVKTCVYTSCSNAGTSTGTTLYSDSNTNMYSGQKLIVNTGNVYEEADISTCTTATITLTSPGLQGSYTDGDVISGRAIQKPTDLYKILVVRAQKISDGIQSVNTLVRNEIREERVIYPAGSIGTPSNYFETNDSIMLYPSPDYAYRIIIEYLKTPADLSSDADTPIFPARYHQLLEWHAIANCYEKDENTEMANYYMQKYQSGLIKMQADYSKKYDGLTNFRLSGDEDLPTFSW